MNERVNPKYSKVLYHRDKFYRNYKTVKTTITLPHIDDKVLNIGAPQLCVDNKLKSLNSDVNTTIGIAENRSQLAEYTINVNEDCKRECGEYAY